MAELILVGDELLDGDIMDTNSTHISRRLVELSIKTRRKTTVGDDAEEISRVVVEALKRRPDYLIIVGGLGFTPDDVTREGLARALKRRIIISERGLTWLRGRLRDREMTPLRKRFACVLEGSEPIFNPAGAACGIHMEVEGTDVVAMPGPPWEVEAMLEQLIGKVFIKGEPLYTEEFYFEGGRESDLQELYEELERMPGLSFGSYPKKEGIHLKIQSGTRRVVQGARRLIEKYKESYSPPTPHKSEG
ncbi:MAG: competence/damage-inducible protein A [Candidatus Geothermarchaeales archaeon]